MLPRATMGDMANGPTGYAVLCGYSPLRHAHFACRSNGKYLTLCKANIVDLLPVRKKKFGCGILGIVFTGPEEKVIGTHTEFGIAGVTNEYTGGNRPKVHNVGCSVSKNITLTPTCVGFPEDLSVLRLRLSPHPQPTTVCLNHLFPESGLDTGPGGSHHALVTAKLSTSPFEFPRFRENWDGTSSAEVIFKHHA